MEEIDKMSLKDVKSSHSNAGGMQDNNRLSNVHSDSGNQL